MYLSNEIRPTYMIFVTSLMIIYSMLLKESYEVIKNLASEKGIEYRVTRSYMAEGAFGVIKQDYNYRRISKVTLKKLI